MLSEAKHLKVGGGGCYAEILGCAQDDKQEKEGTMTNQSNDALEEIARFSGKACAILVRDLADLSQSFTAAFRQGWRETMEEKPKPAPAAPNHAPESG